MDRTHIRLTEPLKSALKSLSYRTGLTVSDIIRRAIEAYLQKERK